MALLGGGRPAGREVDAAVETFVWYGGLTDKLAQLTGSVNPVAGPYFNFTVPEPTGVVGVVAPEEPALAGMAHSLAAVLCGGNTVVALTSEPRPLAALCLGEVLATSDLPGGVVNVLTGRVAETATHLAAHMDVNAVDLAGVDDVALAADLESAAAGNLKRVLRPNRDVDWAADPGVERMTAFLETKTVWHPKGV